MPQPLATRCCRAPLGAVGMATVTAALILTFGLPRLSPAAGADASYPSQNVKFVVAFPAGGPTDALARILGQRLSEKWGQGVVIENRGGAGGNIATRQVAKAEPNGYTVLVTTSAYAVNPSLTEIGRAHV